MQDLPSYPQSITVGSGRLLLSENPATDGWEDPVHVTNFKVKVETEKKESINASHGIKTVGKEIVTKITAAGTFECNYPNKENLAKFFMSNGLQTQAQTSGTLSAAALTAKVGKWIEVGKHDLSSVVLKCPGTTFSLGSVTAGGGNAGTAVLNAPTQGASIQAGTYSIEYDTDHYVLTDPDENVIALSKVEGTAVYTSAELGFTVASGAPQNNDTWTCEVTGTPTPATMVLGTDYLLEAEDGLVMVLSTNTKGVVSGDALTIDASYAEKTYYDINAGTKSQIRTHIRFLGDPVDGEKEEVRGYCSLAPEGELEYIGEEEQKFTFAFKFQYNAAYVDANSRMVLFKHVCKGLKVA